VCVSMRLDASRCVSMRLHAPRASGERGCGVFVNGERYDFVKIKYPRQKRLDPTYQVEDTVMLELPCDGPV